GDRRLVWQTATYDHERLHAMLGPIGSVTMARWRIICSRRLGWRPMLILAWTVAIPPRTSSVAAGGKKAAPEGSPDRARGAVEPVPRRGRGSAFSNALAWWGGWLVCAGGCGSHGRERQVTSSWSDIQQVESHSARFSCRSKPAAGDRDRL